MWSCNKGCTSAKEYFNEDDVIVVLHDSGSRYIGKIYNDEWMNAHDFFNKLVNFAQKINNLFTIFI